jgi:hypothetical protein
MKRVSLRGRNKRSSTNISITGKSNLELEQPASIVFIAWQPAQAKENRGSKSDLANILKERVLTRTK